MFSAWDKMPPTESNSAAAPDTSEETLLNKITCGCLGDLSLGDLSSLSSKQVHQTFLTRIVYYYFFRCCIVCATGLHQDHQ